MLALQIFQLTIGLPLSIICLHSILVGPVKGLDDSLDTVCHALQAGTTTIALEVMTA